MPGPRHRQIIAPLLAIALGGPLTADACGQSTLTDRIAELKLQRERKAASQRRKVQQEILQALIYRDLTVSFQSMPARDVFEYFQTTLGVTVVVRYLSDPAAEGIDPDLPITIEADMMPAIVLLEQILDQCGDPQPCTWQLRRSFLEIGTKGRLSVAGAQRTRTYPVDDLTMTPPRFTDAPSLDLESALRNAYGNYGYGTGGPISTRSGGYSGTITAGSVQPRNPGGRDTAVQNLIDAITDLVEPDAWTRNGGTAATIRYLDGALIVKAPDYVHRQLVGYPRVPRPRWAGASPAP